MRLEPPGWWHGERPADRLKTALFAPAGLLYGTAAKARFALAQPYRSRLPVICVGNFTVGGAGKTPLALAVARMAQELGRSPAFLTRGYGGALTGPHMVDARKDSAADVGDEALLLAPAGRLRASTVGAARARSRASSPTSAALSLRASTICGPVSAPP